MHGTATRAKARNFSPSDEVSLTNASWTSRTPGVNDPMSICFGNGAVIGLVLLKTPFFFFKNSGYYERESDVKSRSSSEFSLMIMENDGERRKRYKKSNDFINGATKCKSCVSEAHRNWRIRVRDVNGCIGEAR